MTQVRPAPRLEPTPLPGVFRVHAEDGSGLDRVNLKGQAAPDGYVSVADARAHGVPETQWSAVTSGPMDPAERYQRVHALFTGQQHGAGQVALPPPMPGDPALAVSPDRATVAKGVLAGLRTRVEAARARGREVVLPSRGDDGVYRRSGAKRPGAVYIDPKRHVKASLSPDEARWVFDTLVKRSERVELSEGRVHYVSPALREQLDRRVADMAAGLMAARAAGKRTMYISTPISSVSIATNTAIAQDICAKTQARFGADLHILNPAAHQGTPGMVGDDYMYMWERLLGLNLFDVARFTSQEDTFAYFESRGQKVPADYLFTYGSWMHSAGCRYEKNLFTRLNRDLAAQGNAHLMVTLYEGNKPMSASDHVSLVDTVSYARRGEILE